MKDFQAYIVGEIAEFRDFFIEKTINWANEEFERLSNIRESDIIQERGYVSQFSRDGRKSHTKASYAYWSKISGIVYKGKAAFVTKAIRHAEDQLLKSAFKVSEKCLKKGMVISQCLIKDIYVIGGNLNFKIVCHATRNVVECRTILAWGDVYRPHYRFITI